MFKAAHTIIYSKDAEADRAFFRDVLGMKHVDVGDGWLIFALPPAEIAVHPAETGGKHEIYFVVESIEAFRTTMKDEGLACTDAKDQGWGVLCTVTLPSGTELDVYEPRHALAHD